jgi:hypothetical protein
MVVLEFTFWISNSLYEKWILNFEAEMEEQMTISRAHASSSDSAFERHL